jgi:hypothetical protein
MIHQSRLYTSGFIYRGPTAHQRFRHTKVDDQDAHDESVLSEASFMIFASRLGETAHLVSWEVEGILGPRIVLVPRSDREWDK